MLRWCWPCSQTGRTNRKLSLCRPPDGDPGQTGKTRLTTSQALIDQNEPPPHPVVITFSSIKVQNLQLSDVIFSQAVSPHRDLKFPTVAVEGDLWWHGRSRCTRRHWLGEIQLRDDWLILIGGAAYQCVESGEEGEVHEGEGDVTQSRGAEPLVQAEDALLSHQVEGQTGGREAFGWSCHGAARSIHGGSSGDCGRQKCRLNACNKR